MSRYRKAGTLAALLALACSTEPEVRTVSIVDAHVTPTSLLVGEDFTAGARTTSEGTRVDSIVATYARERKRAHGNTFADTFTGVESGEVRFVAYGEGAAPATRSVPVAVHEPIRTVSLDSIGVSPEIVERGQTFSAFAHASGTHTSVDSIVATYGQARKHASGAAFRADFVGTESGDVRFTAYGTGASAQGVTTVSVIPPQATLGICTRTALAKTYVPGTRLEAHTETGKIVVDTTDATGCATLAVDAGDITLWVDHPDLQHLSWTTSSPRSVSDARRPGDAGYQGALRRPLQLHVTEDREEIVEILDGEDRYPLQLLLDFTTRSDGLFVGPRWWNGITIARYQYLHGTPGAPPTSAYFPEDSIRYNRVQSRIAEFRNDSIIGFDPLPGLSWVDFDDRNWEDYLQFFTTYQTHQVEYYLHAKPDTYVLYKQGLTHRDMVALQFENTPYVINYGGVMVPLRDWQSFFNEWNAGLNSESGNGFCTLRTADVHQPLPPDCVLVKYAHEDVRNFPELPPLDVDSYRIQFLLYPASHPNHPGGPYNPLVEPVPHQ